MKFFPLLFLMAINFGCSIDRQQKETPINSSGGHVDIDRTDQSSRDLFSIYIYNSKFRDENDGKYPLNFESFRSIGAASGEIDMMEKKYILLGGRIINGISVIASTNDFSRHKIVVIDAQGVILTIESAIAVGQFPTQ